MLYRIVTGFLQAIVLSTLGAAAASGETWSEEYDVSLGTLPSAQGFAHIVNDPGPALPESNYTVAGGLLVQGSTGGGTAEPAYLQHYSMYNRDLDLAHDVIEIDFGLRIVNSTIWTPPVSPRWAGFGVNVVDRHGRRVTAYVGETGAFIDGATATTIVPFDTTDVLHDYRLRISPTEARLFRDGVEIAMLRVEDYGTSPIRNRVQIGDVTPYGYSSSELDGFRIRRFSAPAPEVRNYQVVTRSTPSDSDSPKSLTVDCPPGTVVLTGGASTAAGSNVGVSESFPGPGDPPTSWVGSAVELVDTGVSWDLRVDAVCGEITGHRRVQSSGAQSTAADQNGQVFCPNTVVLPKPSEYPVSGGVSLTGASLRQILTSTFTTWPLAFGPRRTGAVDDYGVGTSSGAWGVDVHAICTDTNRFENLYDDTMLIPGTPKSLVLNCPGGKVPIGGGAFGGDGGLAWSRPKDGAPGALPVGWDAQARGSGSWAHGVQVDCAAHADPTVSANGLLTRVRAEFDAYDSWGFAHGTMIGEVDFVPGVDGVAYAFDDSSEEWVELPAGGYDDIESLSMYPELDFTAAAWIKTTASSPGLMTIASLYDFGGENPQANPSTWALLIASGGNLQGRLRSAPLGSIVILDAPGTINDGDWHHVALTKDMNESKFHLYQDGVHAAEFTLPGGVSEWVLEPGDVVNPDPVTLGAWRDSFAAGVIHKYEGAIDEFAYWDRALTLDEIQNLAGCHRDIGPRVLNLQADRFTSPAGADHTLCVYLEAGTHELQIVDPAANPDARFTAWSPGPGMPWGTAFSVDPEIDGGFTFGIPVGAASAQEAYDATVDKDVTLTLSQPQRVYFSLADTTALDNRGGVSIAVPEPGVGGSVVAGLMLLAGLSRRRPCPAPRSSTERT